MPENDHPSNHIEPMAIEALRDFYTRNKREVPFNLPAHQEQAMLGYSIAISLKRIADSMAAQGGLASDHPSAP